MIDIIIKLILASAVLLLIISGCGGSFERPDDEEIAVRPSKQNDAYDPMGLPEDYEIVPAKYPLIAAMDTVIDADSSEIRLTDDSSIAIAGSHEVFRIQLFTSKTYGPASRELKIATEVFDREIYLDYEVPYYKVRGGDFSSLKEAEEYLPAAIEAGYKNAWVVKVTVNIQKLEDIYEEEIPPLIDPADSSAIVPEQIYDRTEYPEN